MIRFLRLFSAFRQLEADLRAEAESRTLLQDKLNDYRAKYEALQEEGLKAREELVAEQRKYVDFFAFSCSGRTVHGNIPPVVEPQTPPESVPRRPQGRDIVKEGWRQCQEDMEREYQEALAKTAANG